MIRKKDQAREAERTREEFGQVPEETAGGAGGTERRDLPGEEGANARSPEPVAAGEAPPTDVEDPLARAKAEAADYLDRLQRLQAEFDNYRKRIRREQEDWSRLSQAEIVVLFLPILDDLRRAREHAGEADPQAAGPLLILKRLEDVLAKAGLEEQKADPGIPFDPDLHEALLVVPSEQPEGAVAQVLEPGYLFQGRLLRRSKVSCSTGPAPE